MRASRWKNVKNPMMNGIMWNKEQIRLSCGGAESTASCGSNCARSLTAGVEGRKH